MKPLAVDVITYAPTEYFQCNRCEVVFRETDFAGARKFRREARESSLPPELMRDYQALRDWVFDADERYGGRVVFRVVDAASIQGFLKSLRYGVRGYPAVVISRSAKYVGNDFRMAEELIERQLASRAR